MLRAPPGDDYVYVLDGDRAYPDPCSRFQPEGILGPSRVVELPPARRRGSSLDDLVVYELHVGTFSAEGTFDGVVRYLGGLRELGVTAIELMPVATFPGDRGWGYDGVYAYAPHPAYGGPEGLARLVAAAHGAGLGVIVDVVYNHLGPGIGGADRVRSLPERDVPDVLGRGARLLPGGRPRMGDPERRLCWVEDYGIDGLRLDAVRAIRDLPRNTCSPNSPAACTRRTARARDR